jgi:hypothetical protein
VVVKFFFFSQAACNCWAKGYLGDMSLSKEDPMAMKKKKKKKK